MDSKYEGIYHENGFKSLADLKGVNLAEIDFNDFNLIRGNTRGIEQKCLKLCKEYLASNWNQQTIDTIEVRRISGGMTNQLYYCGIKSPCTSSNISQEVAIRFYGEKYYNKSNADSKQRLTDVVIALLVSENQLGPKICGVFEEGQIHQFYKHRQFKIKDQNNKELVKEVFQKLARVHAMDVPIKKSHWLFRDMDENYGQTEKNLTQNQMIKELNCETLLEHNLKDEINWIKDMFVKSKAPMTFTHNDFVLNNIMIVDNDDNRDSNIVLCDFEYSSYGYRGQDFGTFFSEWGRSWNQYDYDLYEFPEDSTIKELIDSYVKESEKILGKSYSENEINSVEQILKEAKLFVLIKTLFRVLLCLKDNDDTEETFPYGQKTGLQFSESAFKYYCRLKLQFIEENAFDF